MSVDALTLSGHDMAALIFAPVGGSAEDPASFRMPIARRLSPTSISVTVYGRGAYTVPVERRKLNGRASRQGSSLTAILGSEATLTPIRGWTAPESFAARPSHIAEEVIRAVSHRPLRFPRHYWSNDER